MFHLGPWQSFLVSSRWSDIPQIPFPLSLTFPSSETHTVCPGSEAGLKTLPRWPRAQGFSLEWFLGPQGDDTACQGILWGESSQGLVHGW